MASKKMSIPKPPDIIEGNDEAVKIYKQIFRFLIDRNAAMKIDLHDVADAAWCRHRLNELIRKSDEPDRPFVQQFESGAIQVTGYHTDLKVMLNLWEGYSMKFGLNILGRAKLAKLFSGSNADDVPDFMDDIAKMKAGK